MNLTEAVDAIEEGITHEEEDGVRRSGEPAFDYNPGADIQTAAGVARLAVQGVPAVGPVQDYLRAVRAALVEARESFRGYHPDPASFGSGTFTEIIRRVDQLLAESDHPASPQSGGQRRSPTWRALVGVGGTALLAVGLAAVFLWPGKDERTGTAQMDAAAGLARAASERLAQRALKAPTPELRLLLAAAAQHLTATAETAAKLLAVQSPDLIRVLEAHTGRVSTLAFSPDGQWLASGSADGQLVLWNVHDWMRSDGAVIDQRGGGASKADADEVRRIRFTDPMTLSVDFGGRANAEYRIEEGRLVPGNPGTSAGGSSTPDSREAASSRFGVLRAVGRNDGKVEIRWGGGDLRALGLAFSGRSTRVVVAVSETKGDVPALPRQARPTSRRWGLFPRARQNPRRLPHSTRAAATWRWVGPKGPSGFSTARLESGAVYWERGRECKPSRSPTKGA